MTRIAAAASARTSGHEASRSDVADEPVDTAGAFAALLDGSGAALEQAAGGSTGGRGQPSEHQPPHDRRRGSGTDGDAAGETSTAAAALAAAILAHPLGALHATYHSAVATPGGPAGAAGGGGRAAHPSSAGPVAAAGASFRSRPPTVVAPTAPGEAGTGPAAAGAGRALRALIAEPPGAPAPELGVETRDVHPPSTQQGAHPASTNPPALALLSADGVAPSPGSRPLRPGGAPGQPAATTSPAARPGAAATDAGAAGVGVASGNPASLGDGVAGSLGDGAAGSLGDGAAGSLGDGAAGSLGDGAAAPAPPTAVAPAQLAALGGLARSAGAAAQVAPAPPAPPAGTASTVAGSSAPGSAGNQGTDHLAAGPGAAPGDAAVAAALATVALASEARPDSASVRSGAPVAEDLARFPGAVPPATGSSNPAGSGLDRAGAATGTGGRASAGRAARLGPGQGGDPRAAGSAFAPLLMGAAGAGTEGSPDGVTGTGSDLVAGFDAPDLAAALSRPFSTGPGQYQLTATLRPPSLGAVTATVRVDPEAVHLELSAASAAGHAALHAALHELESALSHDQRSVDLHLAPYHEQATPGGGGDAAPRRQREGAVPALAAPGAPGADRELQDAGAAAQPAATAVDGHIDLVL